MAKRVSDYIDAPSTKIRFRYRIGLKYKIGDPDYILYFSCKTWLSFFKAIL